MEAKGMTDNVIKTLYKSKEPTGNGGFLLYRFTKAHLSKAPGYVII